MNIHSRPISALQLLYFFTYLMLASVIIFTPILITRSVAISENIIIDEELIEVFLLSLLFGLSFYIFKRYQQQALKQEVIINQMINDKKSADERLFDSLSYIGKVNVQIDQIKSIFNTTNKYPETQNEFKKTFRFLSERTLGIVNTEWTLFRIINSKTLRTISECFETRQGIVCDYPRVSNKMMVEDQLNSSYTTVISHPHNLNILVCCTMPITHIHNDQRVFIQAIINEIIMLFIILNSSYYKNDNVVTVRNIGNTG